LAATAQSRSEALEADNPLAAAQQIHWQIHRTQLDYPDAVKERRRLAVEVGELARELVEVLTAVGWTEEQAREADVGELAGAKDER
jgi:hypothetical protein